MTRGTMELLKAVINLPYESELFLIGAAPQKDIETVQNFVEKYKCDNIRIIGKVPEAELKYLINHCDVGVVYYHQNDLNNKYCASGKVFEFLYEGVPIVSTDNPPLKKICKEYNIGVATNSLLDGMKSIKEKYELYLKNTKKVRQLLSIETNNINLAKSILEEFSQYA